MHTEALAGYPGHMNTTATLCESDISAVGALLADPARATILLALLGGAAVPAGELARQAGVSAATASAHLARLLAAGWVGVERQGRQRHYRLTSPDVARLLEQSACLAPPRSVRSLRGQQRLAALRLARSCYDHLAGQVGVALTEALVRQGALQVGEADFVLTPRGATFLRERGVAVAGGQRRAFARRCLDWSERRHHLAGALGASVFAHWEAQGWIVRQATSRAVSLSTSGIAQLPLWGVDWSFENIDGPSLSTRRSAVATTR